MSDTKPATKSSAPAPAKAAPAKAAPAPKKESSILEIFKELEYGPAPEAQNVADAWFDDHNRKFGLFINNKWVHPEGRKYYTTTCPGTKEPLTDTVQAEQEDVDMAVHAAREAYKTWSQLSGHERAKHLYSLARHVQKHQRLFAVVESLDNGKSVRESRDADIPLIARHLYHHAGWAEVMNDEFSGWKSVGVIAQIVPWNFPALLMSWKVAPALAAGNTIVLKPATYTRLSALLFAEICAEAGLPPGVFNVLTGSGRMGSMMVDHPEVDKVAFTGSTGVGRILRRRIAGSGKKISLELGGKSPVVVFESADLDSAVEGCVDAIWFNQGQVCCAGSRLLVQESVYDEFIKKLKTRMDHMRVGHPLDKNIDMGPLVDKSQYDSVVGYCKQAEEEGCTVYQANIDLPEGGWYHRPTLILDCEPTNTCVREEVFGPVLAAMSFRSPDEAVKLANNTFYGLGGSVWTENLPLALEVAISIKAGAIWINSHNIFDAAAGFGGYRESGFGRDGGREGMYEYMKPKWMPRARPSLKFPTEEAKWSSVTPARPTPATTEASQKGPAPAIDRTPKMYIGGKQCRPDAPYSRNIVNPKSGELIAQVGEGNRKDVRNAVEAAHKAAPGWGKRAGHNRAQICYYIAENLQARFNEFAGRLQAQTGRELADCEREVELSIARLFYWAAYADKSGGFVKETTLYGLVVSIHEPVGVIGIACPDDYPLLGFVSLVAPAIVRANTVVVVPSAAAPLCATDLYQVLDTSDLPAGVCNIVTGDRETLTKTLAEHQDIDAMWYFGTEQGCANVEFVASENMKRTFVNYGLKRDWTDPTQGQGKEFLYHAIEVKNIHTPMGELRGV